MTNSQREVVLRIREILVRTPKARHICDPTPPPRWALLRRIDHDDEGDDLTLSINFTNMSFQEAMIEDNNHESGILQSVTIELRGPG